MRRSLVSLIAIGLFAAACSPDAPSPRPGSSVVTPPPAAPGAVVPEPGARIPREASALARELEVTWTARRAAVDVWVGSGGTATWPPPDAVELLVLREQQIYRLLASLHRLADRVLDRVPASLAAEALANVRAGAALYEHFTPLQEVPDFRTRPPQPADVLLGYFEAAEERFGVEWEVLAAVMLIETRMGRVISRSSAGAQGPMQFLPATWDAYGLGGEVHEERDAVMGAANYLVASGAPRDYPEALYHYNPVDAYVTAVIQYA
ncbi:MAG: lytic transglycosylase domain-containing protein, partial [Actinomycetota bacterium]